MKVAFLTEMNFFGKIPSDHPNMRTEFAWIHALDATHIPIRQYKEVSQYDHVFVIFPKGKVFLSAEGTPLTNQTNPVTDLLQSGVVEVLKSHNKKVYYVQEGPHWWYNDYSLPDQIHFFNMLASCDAIFCHNESDISYYAGLFPLIPVQTIPSLMIENSVANIIPKPENKVIIGGNFARWYGGFESFTVAEEFDSAIWGQTSHASRQGEETLIKQLPRMYWTAWMQQLSSFKYAVHLMPTVAAGTFSLNCAYFGIPCIGNRLVDTQKICHPDLSVDVWDVRQARVLAKRLHTDVEFYNKCSLYAKEAYYKHFSLNSNYPNRIKQLIASL